MSKWSKIQLSIFLCLDRYPLWTKTPVVVINPPVIGWVLMIRAFEYTVFIGPSNIGNHSALTSVAIFPDWFTHHCGNIELIQIPWERCPCNTKRCFAPFLFHLTTIWRRGTTFARIRLCDRIWTDICVPKFILLFSRICCNIFGNFFLIVPCIPFIAVNYCLNKVPIKLNMEWF